MGFSSSEDESESLEDSSFFLGAGFAGVVGLAAGFALGFSSSEDESESLEDSSFFLGTILAGFFLAGFALELSSSDDDESESLSEVSWAVFFFASPLIFGFLASVELLGLVLFNDLSSSLVF